MPIELHAESAFQCHSLRRAPGGLSVQVLPNGCVYAIQRGDILINQVLASPVAGGVHRIYLRIHDAHGAEDPAACVFAEIVGPRAATTRDCAAADDRIIWTGAWQDLNYRCTCWLNPAGDGWFFHVEVENRSGAPVRCDAILLQDLGLATRGQVRNNELFTSQYLDHFATRDRELGYVVMTRQNLPQPGETHPWLMQGCFPSARGFVTDGVDFFGVNLRAHGVPAALLRSVIGESVRQYETAYVALQGRDVDLPRSASHTWSFFAQFVANHAAASAAEDAERLSEVRRMHREMLRALATPATELHSQPIERSVFQTCGMYDVSGLDAADINRDFPGERRHEEFDPNERMLSFFYGDDARHVVLRAKELAVPRPHGHILRAGRGALPDAELLSCTMYAAGVFASQLALGNASLGKLLSGTRDPLNIVQSGGLRIFVRPGREAAWELLGVPSAFEMAVESCRWHYRRGEESLTVSCVASPDQPELRFETSMKGRPVELLICGEIAAGPAEYESLPRLELDAAQRRITVRPDPKSLLGQREPGIVFHVMAQTGDVVDAIGGDELLFPDGESHRLPYFTIRTRATNSFRFTIGGSLGRRIETPQQSPPSVFRGKVRVGAALAPAGNEKAPTPTLPRSTGGGGALTAAVAARQLEDVLTWFARDAMVHLSTPRGLEQANGGAWGVRDVCQGPVEFLLSYDQHELVADVLRRVFAQQYADRGDWPQWFMFPPFQQIQSPHSHGDVLIWPLKALCDYLEHTGDASILHEGVAYTDAKTFEPAGERETILEHVDRLLRTMREQFLPGVSLPRYGEGDWDDSLQPADPTLRERLVSSWTAALMYHTLRRWGEGLAHFGEAHRSAAALSMAGEIEGDFQRHLMPDGIVAGFAAFNTGGDAPGAAEYLLHPSDRRTGIRYRLIPMTRGILSGIFSPQQAIHHCQLIQEHLLAPDGARLMDRPTRYEGGVERTFRRSESAACFGREIGLQYVHAHLRYAEAMAAMGRADDLWRALLVVNPIAVTELVPGARARQRNCYFSSSDAVFRDRYEASRAYDKVRRGEVPVDGGWRIYSSGPGIYSSVVIRSLFGIRRHFDSYEFDPVLPRQLSGAICELETGGRRVRYEFTVARGMYSPQRIRVNGVPVTGLSPAPNPYRSGGVRVARRAFDALLNRRDNLVQVDL